MKKTVVLIVGVISIIIIVVIMSKVFTNYSKIIDVTEVDSTTYIDTVIIPSGITEEEYIKEMMKGYQGDFTLEQIDSMNNSWMKQGNNFEE